MTVPPPQDEPREPDQRENQLRFLVTVGSRYWKLIVSLTAITSLSLGLIGLLLGLKAEPPGVEASVELAVRQSSWEISIPNGEPGLGFLPTSGADLLKRISKRSIIEAVLDELHPLEESPTEHAKAEKLAEIDQALTVSAIPNTTNILVSACAAEKQAAEHLADLAAHALVSRSQKVLAQDIEKTRDFLRRELATLRESLEAAENAQWEFLKEKGLHTYEEVTRDLREKNNEFIQAQATRNQIMASLAEIEAEIKKNHDTLPLALSQISDSMITNLLNDLEALRKEELAMALVYEDEYPPLEELRAEIAETERTVLEAVRRYEGGTGSGTNAWDDHLRLRRQHTQLQLDLAKVEDRITSLQERIEDLFNKLPEFASNSHEYSQIVRDADGFRKQYNKMLECDFDLRTAIRAGVGQLERFTALSTTVLPQPRPKYKSNLIIGAIVGLLVGFSLAIMLDMMDTSIKSQEDAIRYLDKPIIGSIPNMRFINRPKRKKQRKGPEVVTTGQEEVAASIVTVNDPTSPISEAYRILRTNYQLACARQRPKTLMITSAVPGEGKTTTSINLAVAMAGHGARVLLIDGDLRRPNIHRMLRLKRSPGLAEVLTMGIDIHGVMQTTQVENLLVVPSGHVPPNPSELLGSDRTQRLMAQLREEFDLVIYDAPSVIVVTDPTLLATQVDHPPRPEPPGGSGGPCHRHCAERSSTHSPQILLLLLLPGR